MKIRYWAPLCLIIVSLVLAGGCATQPKGPTDEELIAQATKDCVAAANAKDIPKLMTYYSEKFSDSQFGDKAGFQQFIEGAQGNGYLNGLKVDASKAKTTITGLKATTGPVSIEGAFGAATATFYSTKENGAWKITGMDTNL